MDSFGIPFSNSKTISSTSNRERKEEENSTSVIISKRAKFLQNYCRQQPFTLPDSIMHYIAKNPSSAKVYAKLVQSCKYFFIKNPIFIITETHYTDLDEWESTYDGERLTTDSTKINKLWLTDELFISPEKTNKHYLASSIISKFYQCDITCLILHNQVLFYDELKVFVSNVNELFLFNVTVKDQHGSVVAFEKIFATFPKLKWIQYSPPSNVTTITAKTFAELLKIPHFPTLDHCQLQNVPQDFDLESFYTYMKKNKCTQFELRFSPSISDAYMDRLEEIIDEILGTKTHGYKPPFILFHELDANKRFQLHVLCFP